MSGNERIRTSNALRRTRFPSVRGYHFATFPDCTAAPVTPHLSSVVRTTDCHTPVATNVGREGQESNLNLCIESTTGFEPATSAFAGLRSVPLSYADITAERVAITPF